jgi:hypothetical protein
MLGAVEISIQLFALFRERASQPIGKAPPPGPAGCYRRDAGYLDLVDGWYDHERCAEARASDCDRIDAARLNWV